MKTGWFLFFSVVSAYDDASLMQQNLGVVGGDSQMTSAIASLREKIEAYGNVGSLRRMALDSMLSEIEGTPTTAAGFDAASIVILNDVVGICDTIIAELTTEKTDSEGIGETHSSNVNQTNVRLGTDVTNENNANSAKTAHDNCRNNDQQPAFQSAADSCYSLTHLMDQYSGSLTCPPVLGSTDVRTITNKDDYVTAVENQILNHHSGSNMYDSVFQAYNDWFVNIQAGGFSGFYTSCVADTESLETHIQTCDLRQKELQEAYCLFKTTRNQMCTDRDSNHATALGDYNTWWASAEAASLLRVAEGRLLEIIKCVLGVLISDHAAWNLPATVVNGLDSDAKVEACTSAFDLTAAQDKYGQTEPGYETVDSCTSPGSTTPVLSGASAEVRSATWDGAWLDPKNDQAPYYPFAIAGEQPNCAD